MSDKKAEDKKPSEVTEKKVVKTEAEKIWDEIKEKPIEMFALPNQIVSQYCKPMPVDPAKLFVTLHATSVLPALELALGSKFKVETMDKYTVISRSK